MLLKLGFHSSDLPEFVELKKMSSSYVVLENRSLDQWKVTELKEELKRRNLTTKGLKDDLVKRLDEAVRAENQTHDNGVSHVNHPEVPSDDATVEQVVAEQTTNIAKSQSLGEDNNITEKLDINESLEKDNKGIENLDNENRNVLVESTVTVETSVVVSEVMVSEEVRKQDLQTNKGEVSNLQPPGEEYKPESPSPMGSAKPNSSDIGSQVVEVSQVKSDSISIDSVSITEKNELKDNVIADDVKIELDVKPDMAAQPSFSKVAFDDATVIQHVEVAESINIFNKNDSEDVGSPEKLNLDRSSGDDSMEEDVSETKQIFSSQDIGDINEKMQVPPVKEDEPLDVMVEATPAANNTESAKDKSDAAAVSTKRKLNEQEAASNSEVVKRQRRWNSQGLNIPEQQNIRPSVSTTPKGGFQASIKHNFSRSNSSVRQEELKERVVPPSSKAPTNSLRIDRFLRPFTLKAVQELLGKTGTVVSFWMDHIKTHCYVTYSSVDEAVATRNAVYNLQWPANGGRLLVAEFVDQSEVKSRKDAPLPSPATPVATTPTFPKQPPAAEHTFPKQPPAVTKPPQQQLPPPPPLPLPPPPPLSYPPSLREPALPPPPPLPEKFKPPVVTLDDLFRKTRATPRIYYLPLSEEQVAAKLKGQGTDANRI